MNSTKYKCLTVAIGYSRADYKNTFRSGTFIFAATMARLLLSFVVLLAVFATVLHGYFQHVSGGLKQVSASSNYVWGVNRYNRIYYCKRPCTGKWVRSAGSLMQVDANDDEVWGVSTSGYVYKRPVDGSGSWRYVRGRLGYVSASGNGYIWGVNTRRRYSYKCKKPCNGAWQHDSYMKQVDAGEKYVYGVYYSGNLVYSKAVDGSGSWRYIKGRRMKHVSAGAGEVFGVDKYNNVYRCKEPCVGEWERMTGKLQQCDASATALFGVNSHHAIFKHSFKS